MLREFTRLPPGESVQDFPDLAALIEEHEKTLQEFRDGKTTHERLTSELSNAKRLDRQARAEAYRAGKEDPGRKHEEKVLAEIREVEDFMGVREGAYSAVERDISGLVSKRRGEWLPKVEALVEEDNREMARLLAKVREIQARRAQRKGLIEWFTHLPPGYQKVVYAQGNISEDVAHGVLLASTVEAEKEVEDGAA